MTPIDHRHARDALFAIDPGCTRDEWHAIGRAAIAAGLSVDDIVQRSEPAANFVSERDVRTAFRGITANGPTTPATLWRADGGWLIVRWGLARDADDIAAVEAFLQRIGARP